MGIERTPTNEELLNALILSVKSMVGSTTEVEFKETAKTVALLKQAIKVRMEDDEYEGE